MGLSPYSSPADGGVLCVILFNTAMSISVIKEMVRSILSVIGIPIASPWEEHPAGDATEECRASPSESYMEEFRSQTPTLRYDSVCTSRRGGEKEEKECCCCYCCVCLAEFKPDAEINLLSCGHVFHLLCLEKWVKSWGVTCPLCRNSVMTLHQQDDKENVMTCPM
ncbi:hypothetical protein DM860_002872 [Cuscuta australis]|uniref:RING-type domain-containing protein n=1 Tax=Cuscuta australis TaxID=267555 RepID=A0A328D4M7_9ASTE|nr:hypothetical protein DM860_002872 [Cuscuta australis]